MIIAPKINLNGSSKKHFTDNFEKTAHLLRTAIESMRKDSPHGRDFQYDGGEKDLRLAREQHNDRIGRVEKTLEEIMTIWEMVEDQ